VGPQRVVSLNLCADELLLLLGSPQQIASLTWLVKDPALSWSAQNAAAFPSNRGHVEEILLFEPELVLAGAFTASTTLTLLQRLNIPVLKLSMPTELQQVKAQLRQVATALGRPDVAERVIADMDRRLDKLASAAVMVPGSRRPVAALFQPNGLTATAGSLIDHIFDMAGLTNLAVLRDLPNYGRLPLETLVFDQPDLLVMSDYEQQLPSLAQALVRHPVLARTFADTRRVVVPAQTWTCAGPNMITAVEILHKAMRVHVQDRVNAS